MRRGYTLVEVVVALVVLALVLPGLSGMLVSSRKAQVANFRMDQADAWAQTVLDSLAQMDPAAVADGRAEAEIGGTAYAAEVAVERSARVPVARVSVSWKQGGREHRVRGESALGSQGGWR